MTNHQSPNHQRIEQLLPWHASDVLDPAEEQEVRLHVANCVTCRGQLRELTELGDVVREAPTPSFDTDAHLLAVEHRLAAMKARRRAPDDSSSARPSAALRWLLASQVAALAVIAVLLVLRTSESPPEGLQPGDRPAFRTLASPPADAPSEQLRVRVLFAEKVTEQQIRELLQAAGGRIVDGPSAVGLYVVELAPETAERTSVIERLAAFRGHEGVRFAELEGPRQ